ncbi:hypothetical protein GINT2_001625 [Glugoides intestinalis]
MKYIMFTLLPIFFKQNWAAAVIPTVSDASNKSFEFGDMLALLERLWFTTIDTASSFIKKAIIAFINLLESYGISFELLEAENSAQRASFLYFSQICLMVALVIAILLLVLKTYNVLNNTNNRYINALKLLLLFVKSTHNFLVWYFDFRHGLPSEMQDTSYPFGIFTLDIFFFCITVLTLILVLSNLIAKRKNGCLPGLLIFFYYALAVVGVILIPQYSNFATKLPVYNDLIVFLWSVFYFL